MKSPAGHWQPAPVLPGARTEEGLVVYRFGTGLYYANASRLIDDVTALSTQGSPLRWMVLDGAAIGDVDYSAAARSSRTGGQLRSRGGLRAGPAFFLSGPAPDAVRPGYQGVGQAVRLHRAAAADGLR